MRYSICISTRNKAKFLNQSLKSFVSQVSDGEIIVVDDGSTDDTFLVCQHPLIRYYRLDNDRYRNPAIARNFCYKKAKGNILILQSDDVVHKTPNSLELLCTIENGTFNIATVFDSSRGRRRFPWCHTGLRNQRPLFFLGALFRKDCYAIGGNSEDFLEPGFEDYWFGSCLTEGLGLVPKYLPNVVGMHQEHPRHPNVNDCWKRMRQVWEEKCEAARSGKGKWIGTKPWRMR